MALRGGVPGTAPPRMCKWETLARHWNCTPWEAEQAPARWVRHALLHLEEMDHARRTP